LEREKVKAAKELDALAVALEDVKRGFERAEEVLAKK
jgi:hypothetical protein